MPELPEVEFARTCIERWLGGQVLARVEADATRIIRDSSKSAIESLSGRRLEVITRKGKHLMWKLDGEFGLLGHLGMTGKFELQAPGDAPVRWSRVRFFRDDGAVVHYRDPRMFGRMIAGAIDDVMADESYRSLGPDAWNERPTPARLGQLLNGSKRAVKDLLMDQTIIAGIGNIYAAEALFRAGIHPARSGSLITREESARLVKTIHWVLGRSMKMNTGDSIRYVEDADGENPFVIYGRDGSPCPKCGAILREMTIAGRTSVFCPKCQPKR